MNNKRIQEINAFLNEAVEKPIDATNPIWREAISKSEMHGFTKNGTLMYKGSKKESLRLMKVEKKSDPNGKYQLVMSPNLPKPGNKYGSKVNEGKENYELIVAYETLEDLKTMMDIAFDDAYIVLKDIDQKAAKDFSQGIMMLEKASNHMMKVLKKYK